MRSPTPDELVLIVLPYVFAVAFVFAAIYTVRSVARALRYYGSQGTWHPSSMRLALGSVAASALLIATSFVVVVRPTAHWRQSDSIRTTWDWVIAWGYAGYVIAAGTLVVLTILAVFAVASGALCGPLVQEIREILHHRRSQSPAAQAVTASS